MELGVVGGLNDDDDVQGFGEIISASDGGSNLTFNLIPRHCITIFLANRDANPRQLCGIGTPMNNKVGGFDHRC